MQRKAWAGCLVLLMTICVQPGASAERRRNPFSVSARGLAGASTLLADEAAMTRPVMLQARIPGFARVRLRFDRETRRSIVPTITGAGGAIPDSARVRLLRGVAEAATGLHPAAASIYTVAGRQYLFAGFLAEHPRHASPRYYRLTVPLSKHSPQPARVARVMRSALAFLAEGDMLASSVASPAEALHARSLSGAVSAGRVIQLNIDADDRWHAIYGTSSNAAISSYLNEAEAIYQSQLGVSFEVVRQNVFSSRGFGTTNAESKITAYQDYTVTRPYFKDADLSHLFTGVPMERGVIGISYVGVLCISPYEGFALTQHTTPAFVPITFAHELAHNFGARHDDSGASIMNSMLLPPPPRLFSERSLSEMLSFITYYGDCLSEQEPLASTIPVTLTGSYTNSSLTLEVTLDAPRPGCVVELHGAAAKKQLYKSSMLLTSYRADGASHRFTVGLRKRPTVDAFLGAKVTCGDGSHGESAAERIRGRGIKIQSTGAAAIRWLQRLAGKL